MNSDNVSPASASSEQLRLGDCPECSLELLKKSEQLGELGLMGALHKQQQILDARIEAAKLAKEPLSPRIFAQRDRIRMQVLQAMGAAVDIELLLASPTDYCPRTH